VIIEYWGLQSVLDFYLIVVNTICSILGFVQCHGKRVPKAVIGKGLFLKSRSPGVEKRRTSGAGP